MILAQPSAPQFTEKKISGKSITYECQVNDLGSPPEAAQVSIQQRVNGRNTILEGPANDSTLRRRIL